MSSYVLITGATGGLGRAFVSSLARSGERLYLTDRNEDRLAMLGEGMRREYGVELLYGACDLADERDRDRFFESLTQSSIRFHGLINVAGLDSEGEFSSKPISTIRTLMNVNMLASVEMLQRVISLKAAAVPFYVLNVASLAAFQPMPYKALYAASKRFLVQWTLGIREELRPHGIHVSVLCPAGMPTTDLTIERIDAQGLAGTLTTLNTSIVVRRSLRQLYRKKAVIVPGLLNQFIALLSGWIPSTWSAKLVKIQWSKALSRRCRTLHPNE